MDPFEFRSWLPKGAKHVIGLGSGHYVAICEDDETVLKYPHVPPDEAGAYDAKGKAYRAACRASSVQGLCVEEQILRLLGHHPRIVRLQGKHADGLLLEYVPNGSVGEYLRKTPTEAISLRQRLKWARQAAEAVAYAHSKNVLHCDISIGNLLLDEDLDIKLIDFQGKLLSSDGTVLLDGQSESCAMSTMPRPDLSICDFRTDMFALGTTIFYIITGQLPFLDVDPVSDEEEIQRRFREGEIPLLEENRGGEVIRRCWQGAYESAQEVVMDLCGLEAASATHP